MSDSLQWYDKTTNSFVPQQTKMTVVMRRMNKEQEEAHIPVFTKIANEKDSLRVIMDSHDHLQKNQRSIQNWLKVKCSQNNSNVRDYWEEVLAECNDVSEETYQNYVTL